MGLLSELKSNDKKGLFDSNDNFINYSTGLLPLDYANGFWQEVHHDDGTITHEPIVGIMGGTFISIIARSGAGKSQPDDTMIPTPNGFMRLDSLVPGDYVFNRKGNAVKILGIFPQGELPVYTITFSDGRRADCSPDHLWTVIDNDTNEIKTIKTEDIKSDHYTYFDNDAIIKHKYSIFNNNPVEYATRPVPIDPWVMGVLIRYCDFQSKYLSLYDVSEHIVSEFTSKLEYSAHSCKITEFQSEYNHKSYYKFWDNIKGDYILTADLLKDIPGLIGVSWEDKFIPNDYKINSIKNRNEFLKGYYNDSTRILLTTSRLTNEIKNIEFSIGFDDPNKKETIGISGIYNTGKSVSQRCIYVDDAEHLYLTENYIVTHNTTLADQIGYNIIKNFEDGLLYHIDAERTALRQRIIEITGADIEDERINIKKENTSIEDVLEMVTKISEAKEVGGDLYKYESPNRSYNGKPYKVYVPTVLIIDSVVSFTSKEATVEDLGNNMEGAITAKNLTRFVNKCLDRMQKYNITIIMISHIRSKVEVNMYATTPPGIMMLKPGESVPGGMNLQYMCQNFFRIDMNKSNAYTKEDNGFVGFKAMIQIAKSKTNVVGTTFPIAFNSAKGFDPIYTLLEFADSIGIIGGRNPYLYFQGLDTMKFNRKDFRRKFMEEKEFRDNVFAILKPYLESLLGSKEVTDDDRSRYGDLFPDQKATIIPKADTDGMIREPVKAKKSTKTKK